MSISNELFQLAGFFEKYRQTGGTILPEDAARVAARLDMLAVGAGAQEIALKSISDEFDRYIEDQHRDMPVGAIALPAGARGYRTTHLGVIEGGRV